jgi:hypothetical protein
LTCFAYTGSSHDDEYYVTCSTMEWG